MTYTDFWRSLTPLYDPHEAQAVAQLILEQRFGLSLADVLCGSMPDDEQLRAVVQRLLQGEPVQYVLGEAEFCGLKFHVEPGVLIPRPETQQLCDMAVEAYQATGGDGAVLDIGTGSGCIASTLAKRLPQARVTAWDISASALRIASDNARRLGVDVAFEQVDILSLASSSHGQRGQQGGFQLIVSNPPYICQHEKVEMEARVLDHEPAVALFVPDDDPLLFYRAIGSYAAGALQPHGRLVVEINRQYGAAVADLLRQAGFASAVVVDDYYGNARFVKAAL